MKTVRDYLTFLRLDCGLSQAEICRRAGIPQYRLSRWEREGPPEQVENALALQALARKTRPKAKRQKAAAFEQAVPPAPQTADAAQPAPRFVY